MAASEHKTSRSIRQRQTPPVLPSYFDYTMSVRTLQDSVEKFGKKLFNPRTRPASGGERVYAIWGCASGDSLSRNRNIMHHSPARPTSVKTTRESAAICPPKRKPTASKPNSPILPQFNAPMMASVMASLSSIMGNLQSVPVRGRSHSMPTFTCPIRRPYVRSQRHGTVEGWVSVP